MIKTKYIALFATLCLGLVLVVSISLSEKRNTTVSDEDAAKMLLELRQAHIDANVPDDKKLNEIILAGLSAFFKPRGFSKDRIQFDFLRKEPTQTGVAFPKYYLWVRLTQNNRVVDEGAARIAVMDKKEIDVTDFWTKAKIKNDKDGLKRVFPSLLCPEIIKRAER